MVDDTQFSGTDRNMSATNTNGSDNKDEKIEDIDYEGMSTLEEPVSETIKRDLMRIYSKLKIVINPFELGVSG